MWCDGTLSYHETRVQMTSLFQKLRQEMAFRCITLIPALAQHAVSIMEAWRASMPLTHSVLCTVPALNHPCCVGTSVFLAQPSDIHIHLIHNALAQTQHPVYAHIISQLLEKKNPYPLPLFNQILCAPLHLRVATKCGKCGGTPGLRSLRHATKYSTTNELIGMPSETPETRLTLSYLCAPYDGYAIFHPYGTARTTRPPTPSNSVL